MDVAEAMAEQEIQSRAQSADLKRKGPGFPAGGPLGMLLGNAAYAWPTYAITVPATYCLVDIGRRIKAEAGLDQ
jgi:hypothetical protein